MENRQSLSKLGRILAVPIVIIGTSINSACQYLPVVHEGKITTLGKVLEPIRDMGKDNILTRGRIKGGEYHFEKTRQGFTLHYWDCVKEKSEKIAYIHDYDGDGNIDNICVLGDELAQEERLRITKLFNKLYEKHKDSKYRETRLKPVYD